MNSNRFRVESFRGGQKVAESWYSTSYFAYNRAVGYLIFNEADYVLVSKDSKLLARMVQP